MENNESSKISPPYIAWETFKSFLKTLKDSVVPNRIDYSMMPSTMSGFNKAGIMTALRFFSLIDSNDNTTEKLTELVDAYESAKWAEMVKTTLVPAYRNIIGGLKLNAATKKELDEKFGDASSTMKDRFIRFYILMLKESGIEVSQYLTAKQNKPRKSGPRKSKQKKTCRMTPNEKPINEFAQPILGSTPEGMFDQPIPIASDSRYHIRVPKNITISQFELVKAAVGVVETLAKQNEESKK
jgi:hypothetical protein